MLTVRKIKLMIVNENKDKKNEQYNFIRDSQYAQYLGLNRGMGYLMSGYYANCMDIKSEGFKEHQNTIKNSLQVFEGIKFGKGVDSKSFITQKIKKDFSAALKNGLAKGERSITNYKRNFPLMTRGRDLKFQYDTNEIDVLIKWVNKITFKCVLGEHKNSLELQYTLHKIIKKEYKVGQSSLVFDKNNKLILNLTLDIPTKNNHEFIKDRTLGVVWGGAVPAYASINDCKYIRKSFGTFEEFAKVREQFKARRNRLYKQIEASKGGRGRKDKLKAIEQFREKEKNFAKTYNHFLSKNIVNFAKKNKCEYINMEKLDGASLEGTVLGLWSYYQLQEMIKYKVDRENIKVRYVNSEFNSKKCSKCGNIDRDRSEAKSKFICEKCGLIINTDYNSSLNIAMSTDFKK